MYLAFHNLFPGRISDEYELVRKPRPRAIHHEVADILFDSKYMFQSLLDRAFTAQSHKVVLELDARRVFFRVPVDDKLVVLTVDARDFLHITLQNGFGENGGEKGKNGRKDSRRTPLHGTVRKDLPKLLLQYSRDEAAGAHANECVSHD
jgi:hypothetical protein